jgi:hypothetical protein
LPEDETQLASKTLCFFKKLEAGDKSKNSGLFQLTLIMLCSLLCLHMRIWQ